MKRQFLLCTLFAMVVLAADDSARRIERRADPRPAAREAKPAAPSRAGGARGAAPAAAPKPALIPPARVGAGARVASPAAPPKSSYQPATSPRRAGDEARTAAPVVRPPHSGGGKMSAPSYQRAEPSHQPERAESPRHFPEHRPAFWRHHPHPDFDAYDEWRLRRARYRMLGGGIAGLLMGAAIDGSWTEEDSLMADDPNYWGSADAGSPTFSGWVEGEDELPPPPVEAAIPAPRVKFTSEPSGAEVLIDDVYAGTTPTAEVTVASGSHVVIMRKAGYKSWSDTLQFIQGSIDAVRGELAPETDPGKAKIAGY